MISFYYVFVNGHKPFLSKNKGRTRKIQQILGLKVRTLINNSFLIDFWFSEHLLMMVPIACTFHVLLVDQNLENQQHWLPCWHVTFQYAFTFRSGSSILVSINSTLLIILLRQLKSSTMPASNSQENGGGGGGSRSGIVFRVISLTSGDFIKDHVWLTSEACHWFPSARVLKTVSDALKHESLHI